MDFQETLERVLDCFDVDIFKEGPSTYTARLWDEGAVVAEVSSNSLPDLLIKLDLNANMLVSYC